MNGTTQSTTTQPAISPSKFDSISDCVSAFARGEFLIVLDDATRENEGDLIISAAHLTPSTCGFLIRHTSGYLCAPLSPSRAASLDLPFMVASSHNTDPNRTAYCITVDACTTASGVTTGISAADRAATCNALAAEGTRAVDFRRPGHVVPLVARAGGVRERRGHTEAGWEFARLAGLEPAVAVIAEMVEDGEVEVVGGQVQGALEHGEGGMGKGRPGYRGAGMLRAEGCLAFGRQWGIRCCTIEDLVQYVEEKEGKLENGVASA